MIKLYLKQAWQMLLENRLVSCISIAGTTLSVAAVMLIVLIHQINYASYAPETNRYRTLYVTSLRASEKGRIEAGGNNGRMSERVLRETLYTLKTPEAVTGIVTSILPINIPGQRLFDKYRILFTDNAFWTVFQFKFLSGAPFTKADFESGIHQMVISKKIALKLFGTVDAVGRTLHLNFADYTVCGVVDDVSEAADRAYAQAWIPYTVNKTLMRGTPTYYENTVGDFTACILARSSGDFEAICQEVESATARFNSYLTDTEVNFMNSPYSQWQRMAGATGFQSGNLSNWLQHTGALIAFLLLLPALNIIGITLTQFRKRQSEIGVRKSFGAHFSTLIVQVLVENLLISCIGGAIGVLLSYGLLDVCKSFLFQNAPEFELGMLLRPVTFIAAFLFTLVLNLLSVGLPAYKAARMPIVKALHNME